MRRFFLTAAAGLLAFAAFSAGSAEAQVVAVQLYRPYTPVYVPPTITPAYYVAPGYYVPSRVPMIAPSYASTIQVVPQTVAVTSYYAPPVYVTPAPSVYSSRTVETRGLFHQRVIVTDRYYTYP